MTNKPLILTLLAIFVAIAVPAAPQAAVQLVTTKQAIPKNFKTYSLFLVCNPRWLHPVKNAGLLQLYRPAHSLRPLRDYVEMAEWPRVHLIGQLPHTQPSR
jgi:hypothetical protein